MIAGARRTPASASTDPVRKGWQVIEFLAWTAASVRWRGEAENAGA